MIQDTDRQEFKQLFNSWMEVQDQRKELNEASRGIIEKAAAIIDVKKPMIGKIFKVLKKKTEDGEDELEELYHYVNEVS